MFFRPGFHQLADTTRMVAVPSAAELRALLRQLELVENETDGDSVTAAEQLRGRLGGVVQAGMARKALQLVIKVRSQTPDRKRMFLKQAHNALTIEMYSQTNTLWW